jgi:four helix bundle protein
MVIFNVPLSHHSGWQSVVSCPLSGIASPLSIIKNNNMPNRRVEDLRIWIEARLFVKEIYILMRDNRDFGFKDQIQRASVSIMNNIAEGFDSGSDAKFINFLNIAKGSCSEVKSMLYLCEDLEYCSTKERERLHAQLFNISSGIYKFIEYLKKTGSQ